MRIATWNVNSVKQRLEHLLRFLKEEAPDVVCLQELKCQEDAFPRLELDGTGYNIALCGQKSFNGVAILSKRPLEDIRLRLPGDDDDGQARFVEALVPGKKGAARIAAIYLPNGNPAPSEKYSYKLAWMDRLHAHARTRLAEEEPFVIAGDFNVIPEPKDAARPELWVNDALFLPQTREKFRGLLNLGLYDALRSTTDATGLYTFWDYQAGAWQKNNGIRIDHLLLSPQAADRLRSVTIVKRTRAWDKPSDHVPVMAEFDL
ncbi:exodeoxyribonuclease III [Chelatococcus daeguensis]|uniref:Exodeoxyribonuclease III n=2 Tax=Chelatococcus TaxID=28209 RepID=A0AAC9JU94_9HYPH|nr:MULTISPECIES: exodeoxyribonuclease III [Chelatococcus]APF37412.1 exodeoxyribonuclease III [Chelatococcus daeguensis]KZE35348.1 exodeoxyribonuclease III [Chelatococcus daeguensis]MBM3085325.1 exodeoxyribonuclease III [Chelatococcus daeguensis]CUA86432.1 exodeoxyribonuclease III [Chelatococcus sambhunathii]